MSYRNTRLAFCAYKLGFLTKDKWQELDHKETEDYLIRHYSRYQVDSVRLLFITRTMLAMYKVQKILDSKICDVLWEQQIERSRRDDAPRHSWILQDKFSAAVIEKTVRKLYGKGICSAKDWNVARSLLKSYHHQDSIGFYDETILKQGNVLDIDVELLANEDPLANVEKPIPAHPHPSFLFPRLYEVLQEATAGTVERSLPSRVGEYRILQLLAQGGMGKLYLAEDHHNPGEQVVVKVLADNLTEDAALRFKQEAGVHSCLDHPNIVKMYEFGYCQDLSKYYITLEFIAGKNAQQMLPYFHPQDVVAIAIYLVEAMLYAHAKDIIHRDIKPSNILLSSLDGSVKLADFGLGKILSQKGVTAARGEMMGTIHYSAPEQLTAAEKVDHRADIYSLGATMYCMLANLPPYHDICSGLGDVIITKRQRDPTPLRDHASTLPLQLYDLVEKAMSRDIRKRYQAAQPLLQDLQSVQSAL